MTRRNQRLDYLLTPAQVKRLGAVWAEFWDALAAVPVDRRRVERARARMPAAGVSWPLWDLVLR